MNHQILKLRPYQIECLEAIQSNHNQGKNRQIAVLPTGSGKTVIFANLIRNLNKRPLVLVNSLELIDQTKEKIEMICPEIRVLSLIHI